MKTDHILTALLLVLLLILGLTACASAAEVRPIPYDHDQVDLANGEYRITVRNRITDSTGAQYIIAGLYLNDVYEAEQVKALAEGDTFYMNDLPWTVKSVITHVETYGSEEYTVYEIYPVEEFDGYMIFEPSGEDDGSFVACINDCLTVTPAGFAKISLDLPENFRYITYEGGEEQDPLGSDAFLAALENGGFTAYNTYGTFEDGKLVSITHSDYPEGLDEAFEGYPVPVWKFCRGLRDGLDTALITAAQTSCEEGPLPVEITPEEAEQIRSLAMNGMVTDKANEISVTGGTWIYTFTTPGGKHLLSVEMFEGLIVGSDGMYNHQ